ncbi:MAG: rhomboid family intramembrane serine protease [Chitinophagales bacterium]|nr:rhomboid family intramembrane serine protease [Chitinophagales bacterium]
MNGFTPITTAITVVTLALSMWSFQSTEIRDKLIFNPYRIKRNREWYRFLTAGFIHADFGHLLFNLVSFFFFGPFVESIFLYHFDSLGPVFFALMYVLAIIASSIFSYFKHQDDYAYLALGASGAISAVIFSSILFDPWDNRICIYFVFCLPPLVFGIVYLMFSQYMARRGQDNIGHDAHFWGAVFGFIFPILLKPSLIVDFFNNVKSRF